jgi:hypothetical protein
MQPKPRAHSLAKGKSLNHSAAEPQPKENIHQRRHGENPKTTVKSQSQKLQHRGRRETLEDSESLRKYKRHEKGKGRKAETHANR